MRYTYAMQTYGLIFAITAAITWGLSYSIDQKLLENISPTLLMFLNTLVTAIIISPIVIINGEIKSIANFNKETIVLIIVADVLILLGNILILNSIRILGASLASVFEIMYPLFVIIFTFLIYGETYSFFFWLGSGFMLVGSIILVAFT